MTREEKVEDFHQLPGGSLSEFLRVRDAHLESLDTFGPLFPKEPKASAAWQRINGEDRAPPRPRPLKLPFDEVKP